MGALKLSQRAVWKQFPVHSAGKRASVRPHGLLKLRRTASLEKPRLLDFVEQSTRERRELFIEGTQDLQYSVKYSSADMFEVTEATEAGVITTSKDEGGSSLAVQWLEHGAFTAVGPG